MNAKLFRAAGFFSSPSDTKMYVVEYVEYINEFPASVVAFCDQERNEAFSHSHRNRVHFEIYTKLHSCICIVLMCEAWRATLC